MTVRSINSLRERHGILRRDTIHYWLHKLDNDAQLNRATRIGTMDEKDQLAALRAENKKLKEALADVRMQTSGCNDMPCRPWSTWPRKNTTWI